MQLGISARLPVPNALVGKPLHPYTPTPLHPYTPTPLHSCISSEYPLNIFWKDCYRNSLRKWIEERKIAAFTFVEQVADKSENNFMYLSYLLPGIAKGEYNNLSLEKFPQGLQEYYRTHWVRMGMNTEPKEKMVIILFILVEISTPIPCEMMAEIANQDEYEVEKVLEHWVEYLKDQKVDKETCYSIYHTSFLEFLKGKRELKKTRKLFDKVNQRIAEYFTRKMA